MKTLEQIYKEYYKLKMNYCNSADSAKEAVDKVLSNKMIKPHIYKDDFGTPTHIFYDKHVLFFDCGIIYKRVN